jgi:hypothetical protein
MYMIAGYDISIYSVINSIIKNILKLIE